MILPRGNLILTLKRNKNNYTLKLWFFGNHDYICSLNKTHSV